MLFGYLKLFDIISEFVKVFRIVSFNGIFVCSFILFYLGWFNNSLGRTVFGVANTEKENEKDGSPLSKNLINNYSVNLILSEMLPPFIFWHADILYFILVLFMYTLETLF